MIDTNRTQALNADPNRTIMGAAPTVDATVTIKPVQCPICKTFNPAGIMFCVDCGLIFDRALPADAFGAPKIVLPCLVDSSGREHPIRPGTNTIGRDGDIMLVDPRVSRKHATITLQDGLLTLEDAGSTNGTTLNGEPVTAPTPVKQNDVVAFGGLETRLSQPGNAGKTQAIPTNKTATLEAPPSVSAPAAFLEGGPEPLPLKQGTNTFGRKSENDVVLSDPFVSGRHGTIEVDENGCYLTDTGSTNGTLVNDAKLEPNRRTKIGANDEIRIGSLVLKIVRD